MKVNGKKDYVEMPLLEFVVKCPEMLNYIPPTVNILDEKYIVRVRPSTGSFEFGYASDNWVIK